MNWNWPESLCHEGIRTGKKSIRKGEANEERRRRRRRGIRRSRSGRRRRESRR
jgi:hypothetical protein